MTGDVKTLAMGEKQLLPCVIVTITNVKEEGNVVFDVGDAIGAFVWNSRSGHWFGEVKGSRDRDLKEKKKKRTRNERREALIGSGYRIL